LPAAGRTTGDGRNQSRRGTGRRRRAVRADDGRLEATLVTPPPPTEADHEAVCRGFERGAFDPAGPEQVRPKGDGEADSIAT
jgi:hypothetical protein